MKNLLRVAFLIVLSLYAPRAFAQYISFSEAVPFSCLVVCPGTEITLKVPQIQNLPVGSTLQALLSDANGSFTSGGTTIMTSTSWRNFTSTVWNAGPYTVTTQALIPDIVARFTIPLTMAPGTGYKLRMRSSSGYVSTDNMRCPSPTGDITILGPPPNPLARVQPTEAGVNTWYAHLYAWVPSQEGVLNPTLIAQQDFFNTANYLGHVLINSLNFDQVYTATGCPGTVNDGTSISCGRQTNFALRLRRRENFTPGFYQFTIAGDDGIRLSVDGGNTWVLNSFFEQQYSNSQRTTATNFPQGICIGGQTDLVIEYFQRPSDSRLTFTATRLSAPINQPNNQTLCAGGNAAFTLGNVVGTNNTFQWQVSTDSGVTFTNVTDNTQYSGATTATLAILSVPASFNGAQYRCLITNSCSSGTPTSAGLLTVNPGATINEQPQNATLCEAPETRLRVGASGGNRTYQWRINTGSGFQNVPGVEGQDSVLVIPSTSAIDGAQYLCVVTSTCGVDVSSVATLSVNRPTVITTQPVDYVLCKDSARFSVAATGSNLTYRWSVSYDNGLNFAPTVTGTPFIGEQTSTLIVAPARNQNGWLFQAQVTGACGGIASTSAKLTLCGDTCKLKPLSNIITANGDTLNNELFSAVDCDFEDFNLKVYNRWGKEVFTSTNSSKVWNGTRTNEDAPGTYYYVISYLYRGQRTDKKGFVELVR